MFFFFFFQAEDGIRDPLVTGVQTCALPIYQGGADPAAQVGHAGRRRGAAVARGADPARRPARHRAGLPGPAWTAGAEAAGARRAARPLRERRPPAAELRRRAGW